MVTVKDFPMVFYPMDPLVYYPMLWNIPMIEPVGAMSPFWVTDNCYVYRLNPDGSWTWIPHYENRNRRKIYLKLRESDKRPGLYLVYRLLMWCHSGIISYKEFGKYHVDHLDCDPRHNYLENLEIVLPRVNSQRAHDNGLHPSTYAHYTDEQIHKICSDMCGTLTRREILEMNPDINEYTYDAIKNGFIHTDISSQYIPLGFKYRDQLTHERYAKAHQVCALYEFGYTPLQVRDITGYPYSFVYPIWCGRTLRPVSDRYSFPGPTTIETVP